MIGTAARAAGRREGEFVSRFLLLDVGAGTLDVLYYDDQSDIHYKSVVQSPVIGTAQKAGSLPGDLVVTGAEMGGGALLQILSRKAQGAEVAITGPAAMTLSHDPSRVLDAGLKIIDASEAGRLSASGKYGSLALSDLPREQLEAIVSGFGVPFEFDVVGACAQDHGMPAKGQSHLDFRHEIFRKALDKSPFPESLLYRPDTIPAPLNRLRSLAAAAAGLPTREVYVMDSGMAAIRGASMDPTLRGKDRFVVIDVATSHTVCAAMDRDEIAGFFEYHTRDISLEKLESLLARLVEGTLSHNEILKGGGHGAYVRHAFGLDAVQAIIATGPKRRLLEKSMLPITFGAPMGDNMMTGTVGLLESIRRYKGLKRSFYL